MYTAAARRRLLRELEMSCSRMLIASRVPDPGLNPVALMFGGVADHLILCKIIFSIIFPITESSDIGLYDLFFLGIGIIVASFQKDGSLPSCRDRVYSFASCCLYAGGAFLIIEYETVSSPGDESLALFKTLLISEMVIGLSHSLGELSYISYLYLYLSYI